MRSLQWPFAPARAGAPSRRRGATRLARLASALLCGPLALAPALAVAADGPAPATTAAGIYAGGTVEARHAVNAPTLVSRDATTAPQNLAPYVPTPQDVVDRMLELAQVTKDDVVYDIGCGDGRIVITAAKKYGAKGVGIDIDAARIAEAKANAEKAGVAGLVQFRQQDALQADVSPATVVMLSLLPSFNLKLRPILTRQLKPGARIVSLQFDMGNWTPARRELFTDANGATRPILLWTADGTVR